MTWRGSSERHQSPQRHLGTPSWIPDGEPTAARSWIAVPNLSHLASRLTRRSVLRPKRRPVAFGSLTGLLSGFVITLAVALVVLGTADGQAGLRLSIPGGKQVGRSGPDGSADAPAPGLADTGADVPAPASGGASSSPVGAATTPAGSGATTTPARVVGSPAGTTTAVRTTAAASPSPVVSPGTSPASTPSTSPTTVPEAPPPTADPTPTVDPTATP